MTIALDRPQKTKSAQIREKLGYPIIDTDVHTQEFPPAFLDYLEQVAGSAIAQRFQEHLPGASRSKWFKQSWEERRANRTARPPFWTRPTNDALNLATVSLPKLLRDRFLNHFYFGTESDDTGVAQAFNRKANPYGDRVKAFLGSDSGHWDVPDITAVTANAYSMAEREIITEEDLHYFLSIHPLELYTSLNQDFFKGTGVEKAANEYLSLVISHLQRTND